MTPAFGVGRSRGFLDADDMDAEVVLMSHPDLSAVLRAGLWLPDEGVGGPTPCPR